MLTRPVDTLGLALLATGTLVAAAPCDIYKDGGTPCIAAHSTTRSLFDAYNGTLYQVIRDSDGAVAEVGPVSAGGIADAAGQDSFCSDTKCYISVIYDQSGTGNHLTRAPKGGAASGPGPDGSDALADAAGAPVQLDGHRVYGVAVTPGVGYRNNHAVGTATGDGAQGIYAVFDGTKFNSACCFDYGNAETSSNDTGDAHMEALYFGTENTFGTGTGAGPWILADLENGLYSQTELGVNEHSPSITFRFVTAILKGEPNHWSLRGGDATQGDLTTYFDGARPKGYDPMHKEGAIILGIGGDNSNGAQGTFYEGVMTAAYPSEDTENRVQADIVAAKYAT